MTHHGFFKENRVMRTKTFILFFLTITMASYAQEIKSKADEYFYTYAYKQAISAYQKDMAKGELISNHQLLNLADSYFNTGDFKNASKIYLDINKKDSIMNNHHFNKMLQSMSKTSDPERVKAFLSSKEASLSSELMENASFNFELLESTGTSEQKYDIFNVSSNSTQSDLSPAFYKDKLLFSSGRTSKSKKIYGPSGESYFDIYVARIGNDGNVLNANVFDRMPDSEYHKTSPYYSEKSGKIFYILSNSEDGQLAFDENGKNSLAIGQVYENGFFAFLLRDLSTSFYYPYFDEESERLYFAANFEDSYGGTDIYYVTTNNGQIMSAPTNLGPRINSPGNEISPYLFKGDLYFSSDVFYGFGGMDVYKSNLQVNETYSIPVNLGEGVNTAVDDFGFIIKERTDDAYLGYLSSNRKGGKGGDDIYGFRINGIPGLKTFALQGEVLNTLTQNGISQVHISVVDAQGTILKEVYAKEDGTFTLEIPWQEQVTITASKEKYSVFSATFKEEEMEVIQNIPFPIGLVLLDDLVEEKEDQIVLKLNKFYFNKGKSIVNSAIASELDKVVQTVIQFPELRLAIATHTDSRNSSSYNSNLSKNRSDAIKAYLINKGVSEVTIVESLGYGEEKLTNNCVNGAYCLDFLHKQNERTLIKVLNMK